MQIAVTRSIGAWTKNHASVGKRVVDMFMPNTGRQVLAPCGGTVVRYGPASEENGTELFKVVFDDQDEQDYDAQDYNRMLRLTKKYVSKARAPGDTLLGFELRFLSQQQTMERELLNDQLGKVRAREKSAPRDERGLAERSALLVRDEEELAERSALLARDEEELAERSALLARDERGLAERSAQLAGRRIKVEKKDARVRSGMDSLRVAQEELDSRKTSMKDAEWEFNLQCQRRDTEYDKRVRQRDRTEFVRSDSNNKREDGFKIREATIEQRETSVQQREEELDKRTAGMRRRAEDLSTHEAALAVTEEEQLEMERGLMRRERAVEKQERTVGDIGRGLELDRWEEQLESSEQRIQLRQTSDAATMSAREMDVQQREAVLGKLTSDLQSRDEILSAQEASQAVRTTEQDKRELGLKAREQRVQEQGQIQQKSGVLLESGEEVLGLDTAQSGGRELRSKKVESDSQSGGGADAPKREEKTATLLKSERLGKEQRLRPKATSTSQTNSGGASAPSPVKEDLEGVFGKESNKIILGVIQWHSGKRVMSVIDCDGQMAFNHSFCTRCGAAKECFRQKVKAKLRSG
ncbi:hypothetical protein B484DRAFT_402689 [Ochromonadaceae sp. CCMP2298]|nr:hypothetical protein B484DRAFT_402689 [Ochromonadaceae sp. CCMP2298]